MIKGYSQIKKEQAKNKSQLKKIGRFFRFSKLKKKKPSELKVGGWKKAIQGLALKTKVEAKPWRSFNIFKGLASGRFIQGLALKARDNCAIHHNSMKPFSKA